LGLSIIVKLTNALVKDTLKHLGLLPDFIYYVY